MHSTEPVQAVSTDEEGSDFQLLGRRVSGFRFQTGSSEKGELGGLAATRVLPMEVQALPQGSSQAPNIPMTATSAAHD